MRVQTIVKDNQYRREDQAKTEGLSAQISETKLL